MNDPDIILQRLAAAARRDVDPPLEVVSPGLATRVLVRIRTGRPAAPWETLSLGAIPIAAAITVVCVWLGSTSRDLADDPRAIAQFIVEDQVTNPR
jgi:hypothetical protein